MGQCDLLRQFKFADAAFYSAKQLIFRFHGRTNVLQQKKVVVIVDVNVVVDEVVVDVFVVEVVVVEVVVEVVVVVLTGRQWYNISKS